MARSAFVPVLLVVTLSWSPVSAEKEPPVLSLEQLFALRPAAHHHPSDPFVLRLLREPALARRVLAQGAFVRRAGRYGTFMVRNRPKEPALMFRLHVRLAGHPEIDVFFKPQQQGYHDWATETAVCRLANYLGVAVAPCHERRVSRAVLAGILRHVPATHKKRLRWEPDGQHIFGFFRLWAPRYRNRLGPYLPSARLLRQLAGSLRVQHRDRVLRSPLHRGLADLFVLDFLVYNNDRRRNLGSLRVGRRGFRLYPIDFGDGLTATPHRKLLCRQLLLQTALFRRALIDKIRGLTRPQVDKLLTHPRLGLLVESAQIKLLFEQRRALLEHVRWVVQRYGPRALY